VEGFGEGEVLRCTLMNYAHPHRLLGSFGKSVAPWRVLQPPVSH
jgi:hypothetical protein